MFRVIEGNVFLTDDQGDSLTTVSGADGPILKVATDIDLTISGGETLPVEITNVPLPVEEQNLDSEGYINNSAHNYGKIGANWSPFTLTDDGRLRIDIQTDADSHVHAFLDLDDTPTTYSGSEDYYLKVKSTADGIEFVQHTAEGASHFDLDDIGITTHSGIDVHIADGTIHFPWSDVETLVSTTSGTLQTQIDDHTGDSTIHFLESDISHLNIQDIGTTSHSGIDEHIADGDIHFPWSDVTDLVDTTSGTLQTEIDDHIGDSTIHFTEAEISHLNIQDIGTTTHSGIDAHIADGDIHFSWSDVDGLVDTTSGTLQTQIDFYKYHGNLFDLNLDHHPVYVPRDGSRGFTSTVSGVYPIEDYHLATKFYIDELATAISGAFDDWHAYDAVEYEESTTSTDWVNRMSLTVSGIPDGDYRLAWYWEWRISKTGKVHSVRIVLDDDYVDLLAETDANMIQTANWLSAAGFYHTTFSGEAHHMDLDWKIDSAIGGTTGYLRKTRLEFWRTG